MLRVVSASLVLSLIGVPGWSQSLGEIAKREKERRQKNRERGAPVRVIDASEVSVPSQAETEDEPDGSLDEPVESEGTTEQRSEAPDPTEERRRLESEWRGRASKARERIERARDRYEHLSGLALVEGQYYVDEEGRPAITSLAQLRQLVREAEEELQAAAQAMEALREEARRAGIPPGWLR